MPSDDAAARMALLASQHTAAKPGPQRRRSRESAALGTTAHQERHAPETLKDGMSGMDRTPDPDSVKKRVEVAGADSWNCRDLTPSYGPPPVMANRHGKGHARERCKAPRFRAVLGSQVRVRPGVIPPRPVRNRLRSTPFETRFLATWHKKAQHCRNERVSKSFEPRFLTTNGRSVAK